MYIISKAEAENARELWIVLDRHKQENSTPTTTPTPTTPTNTNPPTQAAEQAPNLPRRRPRP